MKSKRNKTIDFNIQEGQRYLKNCITADDTLSAEKIIDKTIVGDTFDVLKKLPRGIFDLMIADPPAGNPGANCGNPAADLFQPAEP